MNANSPIDKIQLFLFSDRNQQQLKFSCRKNKDQISEQNHKFLEEFLQKTNVIKSFRIKYLESINIQTIKSIFKGVEENKSIKSFYLNSFKNFFGDEDY